jgi:hypothetical protein
LSSVKRTELAKRVFAFDRARANGRIQPLIHAAGRVRRPAASGQLETFAGLFGKVVYEPNPADQAV